MIDVLARVLAFAGTIGVLLGLISLTGCNRARISPSGNASLPQVRSLIFSTFDVSPDGKTLVFSGINNDHKSLYLLDLTTQKVTQLTNTSEDESYPSFSPDGKTIVYQSTKGPNKPCHLFLRSLDGKHIRQLTNTPATQDDYPRFSPNGEKIVFARSLHFQPQEAGEEAWGGNDAFVINRNGSHLFQVTHLNNGGMMRPTFYPDNRHILFEKTNLAGSPFSLASSPDMYIARADTNGQERVQDVVKFSEMDSYPCFYPDGKKIVFCGNFNGTLDLYSVSLTGGKPSRLITTSSNTGLCNPVIPSDGKSIYCMERYNPNIYKMNIDGSGLHQIADSSLFSDPMHWRPSVS
jgi:Tol biopolymer transport system component